MKSTKKLMFFLNASAMLVVSESQSFFQDDIFEELKLMHEFSSRMHDISMKRFERARKQEKEKPECEISFDQQNEQSISLKISNFDIRDESISAILDEAENYWKIPAHDCSINLIRETKKKNHALIVEVKKEVKKEQQDDQIIMSHYYAGSNQTYVSLKHDIDFAHARFEYDKQEKMLQIEIPYMVKPQIKVPVTIKNTPVQEK